MRWRGCHLDVARRFYSSEEIKQFLGILAWNKLNVFHWHLSDDEAFQTAAALWQKAMKKKRLNQYQYNQKLSLIGGSGPRLRFTASFKSLSGTTGDLNKASIDVASHPPRGRLRRSRRADQPE